MKVFSNYKLNRSIISFGTNNFSQLGGFVMMVDSNTTYYVIEWNLGIFLLNDYYDYLNITKFSKSKYMITVNSSFYITGTNNIWKTDKYLNVLIEISDNIADFRDIFFNRSENLIYVAPKLYQYIQVFNLNLILQHTINISSEIPRAFSEYNYELYVGTLNGSVRVIVNKSIIRSFTACSNAVTSMVSDECGLIAIACSDTIKLYYYNGTYTGKSLATPAGLKYIGFDSKRNFVALSQYQISIYN